SRIYTQGVFHMGRLRALSEGNDRVEQLKQLLLMLADAIEDCESKRDLASLSRQYRETAREIDILENGEDADDDLAAIILRHRQPASD
ncbi:MAG: hypothetical protein IJR41_00535, partial [Atopobiaceae bacterium]|nr:hypothetical protein [Atopobiaceae bacterium]